MLVRTILEQAVSKARLQQNDSFINKKARESLEANIRRFSDMDMFSPNQDVASVADTVGTDFTIGRPVTKKGKTISFVYKVEQLPDLTNYDPEVGPLVMDRDYYYCKATKYFYQIVYHSEDERYTWGPLTILSNIADLVPDVIVWDYETVKGLIDSDSHELTPVNLKTFVMENSEHIYNVQPIAAGVERIRLKKAGNLSLIYNTEINMTDESELQVPYAYINLLVASVAVDIARTSSVRDTLLAEKQALVEQIGAKQVNTFRKIVIEE